MNHLQLRNISVHHNNQTILHNIHLDVYKGDKILIQGPSGGGKSTLLKAILGFAKGCTGNIIMDDQPITGTSIRTLRNHFAYIGQKPLLFEGSVAAFLDLPFSFKHNSAHKPDTSQCLAILGSLGFDPDILDSSYPTLSGGEQQRITIAQALLLHRDVYLLDEVTSSLDQDNIFRVINLFQADSRQTVIAVSHNKEWAQHATRIFTLQNGQMHETGGAS